MSGSISFNVNNIQSQQISNNTTQKQGKSVFAGGQDGDRYEPVEDWGTWDEPEDLYQQLDFNNDEDYEKACEEAFKSSDYKGNPKRRLPFECDYLFTEAEELEHCFEKNWVTGESPFIEEFVDWYMDKENIPENICEV